MNLIFDFDGTIVDSFDYVLGFLAKEAKRPTPKGKDAEKFRGKSMKDMALALGVPYWRLPISFFKGRRVMREHMDNLKAFDGMLDVIKEFDEQGHRLYIISSNSSRNIKRFLIKNNLTTHFWAVRGSAGLFGKDNLIRQLKYQHKLGNDICYIGDELADIRAAKAAKVKMAAVTWGFADRGELAAGEPNYLVDNPKELLKVS